MTVAELVKKLQALPNQNTEIYVAHDEEDGEEILKIENTPYAYFIIYKKEEWWNKRRIWKYLRSGTLKD